jgi:hypothetical protein
MTDEPSRPEHIDLARLVAQKRAGATDDPHPRQPAADIAEPESAQVAALTDRLREALSARDMLAADPTGQQAMEDTQAAILNVLTVFEDPQELLVLTTLARWLREASGRVAPDPAVMVLVATLLKQPADQPLDIDQLIESVRADLEQFGGRTRESVSQPIPDGREARAVFSSFLQILLDVTISLLTNLMVAAAWTLTAVQDAAHRAAFDTVEVAGRVVDYVGYAWPSLVAVSALAVEAAASVGIARQAWECTRSLREPRLASPIDERSPTPVTRPVIGAKPLDDWPSPEHDADDRHRRDRERAKGAGGRVRQDRYGRAAAADDQHRHPGDRERAEGAGGRVHQPAPSPRLEDREGIRAVRRPPGGSPPVPPTAPRSQQEPGPAPRRDRPDDIAGGRAARR